MCLQSVFHALLCLIGEDELHLPSPIALRQVNLISLDRFVGVVQSIRLHGPVFTWSARLDRLQGVVMDLDEKAGV
jgi:hypothetical protein